MWIVVAAAADTAYPAAIMLLLMVMMITMKMMINISIFTQNKDLTTTKLYKDLIFQKGWYLTEYNSEISQYDYES